MAAGAHHRAAVMHGDVVPVDEGIADRSGTLDIVSVKVRQRVLGQHDAPAEGIVGLVALDDDDLVRRIAQLE